MEINSSAAEIRKNREVRSVYHVEEIIATAGEEASEIIWLQK